MQELLIGHLFLLRLKIPFRGGEGTADKERELKEGRKKARVPALPKSTSVDGSDMISD